MEMPYLYEEGPKTETRIRFRVGDLNLLESLQRCARNAERKDTTKRNADLKLLDRKSTRLNSSHLTASRMPSSA